jgi:hypothetical protein
MRTRRRATIEDLRLAIDCLPHRTRTAMLAGLQANDIIVGAYSTSDGICPMLAAHRAGGRTSLISFAEAWDRVAFRDARKAGARRATERELLILRTHLEASLLAEETPTDELAAARAEHEALMERRRRQAAVAPVPAAPASRPGDPDRGRELRGHPGWSWTRVVRRYDEYESLLLRIDAQRRESEAAGREPVRTA